MVERAWSGRAIGALWSLFAVALALWLAACPARPRQTLVLLITCDTLRVDRLGAYGSTLGLTPNLDALLAESELFTAAFAPTSYTLPSVSALMTGRYPEEVGIVGNVSLLTRHAATLASVLRLHGWRTGAVVSNYVLRRGSGVDAGFEHYDDELPQREANRDVPERIAEATTDAALRMLDRLVQGPRAPRLLWVHYQDPHGPYLPPEGYRERHLAAEQARPDGRLTLPVDARRRGLGAIPAYQYVDDQYEVAFYRAGYDGEVAYFDAEVGRLLAGVEERFPLRETIVVFTADHGESLGEQDYWFAHGELISDPLVRVPLALRTPGRDAARRQDLASLVDVFPTLLALLGLPAPDGYPGRDLLAPGAADAAPEVYLATLGGSPVTRFGLVADGHKLVVSRSGDREIERLYRLDGEPSDGVVRDPARSKALRARLERLRAGLQRPAEHRQELTPAERERLRQLGYLVDPPHTP